MRLNAKLLFLFLIVGGVLISHADANEAMSKQESIEKFVLGNQAYKEGNYELAIKEYVSIIQGDKESGQIYYNLANAYFKQGQLGQSILYYEKARQLIPRDSDLDFNYKYAQSLMTRTVEQKKENFIQSMISGHIHFYTLDEMAVILTTMLIALCLIIFISRIFKWGFGLKLFSRALFVGIITIYSLGLVFKIQDLNNKAIIIQATSANFEPSDKATSHFELSAGMAVKIVRQKDGWFKVRRSDGRLGWVQSTQLRHL